MDKLSEIAGKSNNDIIILVIVLIIGIILLYPMYKEFIKAAKQKRDYYTQEKKLLIDVVQENTKALTKLTTFIEGDTVRCQTFERALESQVSQVYEKVDKMNLLVNEIYDILIENIELQRKENKEVD